MKKRILFLFIILSTVVLGYAQNVAKENITCQQALDLIQKFKGNSNFVILDLRPAQMYKEGHMEGSIYFDVFSNSIDSFLNVLDKNKTYLLYCNAGYRSGIALNKMKAIGFQNLFHLYEGIQEWKKKGFKVVKVSE